jgi:hypothetical protein
VCVKQACASKETELTLQETVNKNTITSTTMAIWNVSHFLHIRQPHEVNPVFYLQYTSAISKLRFPQYSQTKLSSPKHLCNTRQMMKSQATLV